MKISNGKMECYYPDVYQINQRLWKQYAVFQSKTFDPSPVET